MFIKDDKAVSEEKDLVETFNKHYTNIVENSSRIKLLWLWKITSVKIMLQ